MRTAMTTQVCRVRATRRGRRTHQPYSRTIEGCNEKLVFQNAERRAERGGKSSHPPSIVTTANVSLASTQFHTEQVARLERSPNTGCSRFAHSHRHTRSVLYAASCETRKPRWRGAHTEDEAARAVQTQIPELPAFFPVYVSVRSWVNARATFSLPRRMAAAVVLQVSRGRGATSTAM